MVGKIKFVSCVVSLVCLGSLVFADSPTISTKAIAPKSVQGMERVGSVQQAQDYYYQGLSLAWHWKTQEANTAYDRALALNPNYFHAMYQRGLNTFNLDERLAYLTKALQLKPDAYYIYWHLGVTYEWMGRNEEGLEAYNKGIQLQPSYPAPYYSRQHLYQKMEKGAVDGPDYSSISKHLIKDKSLEKHLPLVEELVGQVARTDLGHYVKVESLTVENRPNFHTDESTPTLVIHARFDSDKPFDRDALPSFMKQDLEKKSDQEQQTEIRKYVIDSWSESVSYMLSRYGLGAYTPAAYIIFDDAIKPNQDNTNIDLW